MKYYIIAGEASGDLHGSNLMKGLKISDPNATFRFWGGDLMAAQGGELVKHYKESAIMGFVEVLGSLKTISANLKLCKRDILEFNPHIVILIDYPGFNFRIAKFAKENNFIVFYYIAPKVWAWKESRVKKLKAYTDRLFIIFPFEIPYFKKHGIEAIYNGNPLLDSVADNKNRDESESQFRLRTQIGEKPIIGLLAGSRLSEIKYLLPTFVQLEREFPDYCFLLAGAPSISKEVYSKYLEGTNIVLLQAEAYSIMRHAKITVLASGTASLEAALLNSPQIVCYGGNEISFQIAKKLIKVKYVSLVNLILDKPLVKELLQHQCNVENISAQIRVLLKVEERERVQKQYEKLRKILGGEGASVKVAKAMVEEYNTIKDEERFYTLMDSPIGMLRLISNNQYLIAVEKAEPNDIATKEHSLPSVLQLAVKQLNQYFNSQRKSFDIPIKPIGTEFQLKVWKELREIPFGKVKSYGQIAQLIGDKSASRAVGNACRMNPLLIITPCHRVVGSKNNLTGFNLGVDKKSYLLNLEKAYCSQDGDLFVKENNL